MYTPWLCTECAQCHIMPHQVEVEVDAGPRDAGNAVEPEAGDGRDAAPRDDREAVDVASVVVHAEDELGHALDLKMHSESPESRDVR